MQIVMETDEANSLMSVITSYVIDHAGLSQDGKQRVRKWRTDRAPGSPAMDGLAIAMNEALGSYIEEKTDRQVRRKGRFTRVREASR
jgi:hypothetical protein